MTWHVVTDANHIICGVYGAALLSDAQECARRIERRTGLDARVSQIQAAPDDRPCVGQFMSA